MPTSGWKTVKSDREYGVLELCGMEMGGCALLSQVKVLSHQSRRSNWQDMSDLPVAPSLFAPLGGSGGCSSPS